MKQISIALIGCGAVSEHYYVPTLKKLGEGIAAVEVLYDPNRQRAEKLKRNFDQSVIVGDLAGLTGIDLAIVASPVGFHAEQSVMALGRGINVLCEKPMALTSKQCQAMIDAAQAQNKLLAIGHFRRQMPAALAIKEILRRKLLGEVESFQFQEGSPFEWPATSSALFEKALAGGGVLMDLGVHLLDLALWFFGEVEGVLYEDDAMGGIEANCRLQLQFACGARGTVRLSRDWYLDNSYTIQCEKGKISWRPTQPFDIDVKPGIKEVDEILARYGALVLNEHQHLQGFFEQLQVVARAVAEGKTGVDNLVVGTEAIKSIQLIETCYSQSKLMAMPWFNDAQLERARALHMGALKNG